MDKRRAGVAAAFTATGITGLAALNLIFSPGYIWFYYAAYAALWWPLAEFFLPHNRTGFTLTGSAMTAVFLIIVNLQNSPWHLWFLYVIYPLALWPAVVHFTRRGKYKGLSICGGILTIAYLIALNVLESPEHPWYLYACFPLLWWPVTIFMGKKAGTLAYAWIASIVTIVYYAALNVFISPGFPWAICPAFAVLWWPLSLFFARRRAWVGYAAAMSLWTILFLFALNLAASPGFLWAAIPSAAILWWPVTMFFAKRKAWVGYAVAGALMLIGGFTALNVFLSPHVVWAIYPVFAVLWWPMSVLFAKYKRWVGYSIAGALLFSIFITAVNWITSPGTLWSVFPVFAILWWPMTMIFARRKNWVGYSITATALLIAFFAVINRLTSPGTVWAIYPVFAVLWWPMTMLFARYKNWLGYAVAGAALISAFLVGVNLLVSPGVLWSAFPVFAVLWWPLAVYFFKYRKMKVTQ